MDNAGSIKLVNLNPVLCWNPDCCASHNLQNAQLCGQCGAQLWLGDRYQALQLLGKGGSGRTFLAIDSLNALQVVVKQFSSTWLAHRTLSSAQATIQHWRLHPHPQIPRVLHSIEQADHLHLIQTYIAGERLGTTSANPVPWSSADVVKLLVSLLPLLHQMHSQGMVDCDIKPANIIRRSPPAADPSSEFALVDWSTARWMDLDQSNEQPAVENPDMILGKVPELAIGSPEYAAPEQLRGNVSAQSDLYSLGVVCIHLLTGVRPFALFDGQANCWVWQQFWQDDGTAQLKPLIELLNGLIAPNPTQRLISAQAAIAALQTFSSLPVPNRPVQSPSPVTPTWQADTTLHGHQGLFAHVNAVAISPPLELAETTASQVLSNNTLLASASDDKTIRLWELPLGKAIGILKGHTHFVHAVAFHPQDGRILVSGSRDRTLKRWHLRELYFGGKGRGHEAEVQRESQFSSFGMNADQDKLSKCMVTHTLNEHTQAVLTVGFTPDGQHIISGSADKTVKLWDQQTGELIYSLNGHRLAVTAIAVSPSHPHLLASASADTTIKLWNLATGECVQTLTGHTSAIRAIAISPNGTWLASGGEDRTIRIVNLETQQWVRSIPGHPWAIAALQFMPDNTTLVSGSWDRSLKFWCIRTGQALEKLTGHTDSISSIAISPDARQIASGSHDATLKLWTRSRQG
jgi:WD40 repeat protein